MRGKREREREREGGWVTERYNGNTHREKERIHRNTSRERERERKMCYNKRENGTIGVKRENKWK